MSNCWPTYKLPHRLFSLKTLPLLAFCKEKHAAEERWHWNRTCQAHDLHPLSCRAHTLWNRFSCGPLMAPLGRWGIGFGLGLQLEREFNRIRAEYSILICIKLNSIKFDSDWVLAELFSHDAVRRSSDTGVIE